MSSAHQIQANILSLTLFFFLSWMTTVAQPASLILFIAVSFRELLGDFWPMGVLLWKIGQDKREFTILSEYLIFFKPPSSTYPMTFCKRFSWQLGAEGWGVRAPAKFCEDISFIGFSLTTKSDFNGWHFLAGDSWMKHTHHDIAQIRAVRFAIQLNGGLIPDSVQIRRRRSYSVRLAFISEWMSTTAFTIYFVEKVTRRQRLNSLLSLIFHSGLFHTTLEYLSLPVTTEDGNDHNVFINYTNHTLNHTV